MLGIVLATHLQWPALVDPVRVRYVGMSTAGRTQSASLLRYIIGKLVTSLWLLHARSGGQPPTLQGPRD